jgi:hypothetical protein
MRGIALGGALVAVACGPAKHVVRAAPTCEERSPAPPTAACPAPPADVVARTTALVAAIADAEGGWAPKLRFGCELSRGWLVAASFRPTPAFGDGVPTPCPPAADSCGVDATWIMPPAGAAELLRGVVLDTNLDVDGDGMAESMTHDDRGATVWFDAGTKPVRITRAGSLVPWQHGYVLADLDGDIVHGFVRGSAHVYRVEPSGITARDDIASAMWESTVAARCPVADVIVPGATSPAPPSPLPACPGPDAAQRRISDEIAARIRARGMRITDGAPDIRWSCNRADPLAVVTYCEGLAVNACGDEHGTWVHELWAARGVPALVRRTTSGSVLEEWAVTETVAIVTALDLDGDGQLDPIIESVSHEGGATRSQHALEAYVGGKLVAIAQLDAAELAFEVVRLPGATADALVVRDPETHAADRWSFADGRMHALQLTPADAIP